MEKIVILTDNSEKDDMLIECLSMLFPECKIEILSRHDGELWRFSDSHGGKPEGVNTITQ